MIFEKVTMTKEKLTDESVGRQCFQRHNLL